MIQLREIADRMLTQAKELHHSDGQAPQTLVIVTRGQKIAMLPIHAPLRSYEEAIIQSLRMLDGYALLFCAELWMTKHQMPKSYPDVSVLDLPEPKEDPNRGECLRVLIVTAESISSKFSVIKRTPFGTSFDDQEFVEQERAMRDGTTEFLQACLAAK